MRCALFRILVTALVLTIGLSGAQAQTANEPHPDWTGSYALASNRDLAGTGFQQDAPGEQLNGLITPYLQPWAKARMEATDGIADDTGQVCLPDGIFRYPSMPACSSTKITPGKSRASRAASAIWGANT